MHDHSQHSDHHAASTAAWWDDRWSQEHVHRGARSDEVLLAGLAAALQDLEVPAGSHRVLDVGCGTGRDALWLAARGYDVVGVDFSEAALQLARESTPDDLHVSWVLGAATALPTEDDSCALVHDCGCLHHLAPNAAETYAAEVERVLVTGGIWLLRDMVPPGGHEAHLSAESVSTILQRGALSIHSCETFDVGNGLQEVCATVRRT